MAQELTYMLINSAGLAIVGAGVWMTGMKIEWRRTHAVMGILVLMTLIFDSFMVLAGTYTYNQSLVSGWKLGCAPIEDVAYSLAAAMLVPAVWVNLRRRRKAM